MKAWLKLGLIFLIPAIIGSLGAQTCNNLGCIIFVPFALGFTLFQAFLPVFLVHIINLIIYFLLGALIGWIYWFYKLVRNPLVSKTKKIRLGIILIGSLIYPLFLFLYIPFLRLIGIIQKYNTSELLGPFIMVLMFFVHLGILFLISHLYGKNKEQIKTKTVIVTQKGIEKDNQKREKIKTDTGKIYQKQILSKKSKILLISSIVLFLLFTIYAGAEIRTFRKAIRYVPINNFLIFVISCALSAIIGGFFVLSKFQGRKIKIFWLTELFSMIIISIYLFFFVNRGLSFGGDSYMVLFVLPLYVIIALIITAITTMIFLKRFR